MNLAGELVISKSRFFEIARGLDELFRDSNAQLLAADTLDRLDGIARGLEGRRRRGGMSPAGRSARWAAQVRRLRENFRAIQDELDLIRQGRERLGAMAEAIDHLSRVSDGIQRGVLETRMVPIGPLFDRFQRVIRDLRLVLGQGGRPPDRGGEDRARQADDRRAGRPARSTWSATPSTTAWNRPTTREAAGKPRAGTVSLAASHRGNSVVITVSDDGRGIDCERVRRKAVAKGLIAEDESRRLTDRQVVQYIWHPGLSTAETITDISGRGVGHGHRQEPDRGPQRHRRRPLRARPGDHVHDPPPADPGDHAGPARAGRRRGLRDPARPPRRDRRGRARPGLPGPGPATIEIRGRIISLVAFGDVFRGRAPADRARDETARRGRAEQTVVVVSDGETTIGLIVDELLGMQEAVLKSLEKNFRPVAGLSGASILGDGRVSPDPRRRRLDRHGRRGGRAGPS